MSQLSEATPTAAAPEDTGCFSFRKMSGLDQIEMNSDFAWQALDQLDPKLWMALSCPTTGLEFSPETLKLLDTDNDGRIRAQEVKEAVAWVCERVKHPAQLTRGVEDVDPASLRDDTPAGQDLLGALRLIQQKHGIPEDAPAELATIDNVVEQAATYAFNGDGIIPPSSAVQGNLAPAAGQAMQDYLTTALSLIGGKRDASGAPGIDADLHAELQDRLARAKAWRKELVSVPMPLGSATSEAWLLIRRLQPKIEDFFCRCRVAQFAPGSGENLNAQVAQLAEKDMADGVNLFDAQTLTSLPLAKITAEPVLPLDKGLNPAYEADVQLLANMVAPLLGQKTQPAALSEDDWKKITGDFAPYAALLDKKPVYDEPSPDAERVQFSDCPELALANSGDSLGREFLPLAPNLTLDQLSEQDLDNMLSSQISENFASLVKSDKSAPSLDAFRDLRKLALFNGHLDTFLRNFLSFMDFYDPDKKAIFQAGRLYLDSRCCLLCVPVDDIDAHARLAEPSHLCLIYCACTRKAEDGSEQNCTITAALTEGTLASLLDGRHGLFIDNNGKEWDSQIVRIVHNPISLREAMWAPYIRVYNMAGEQIQKFIASKNEKAQEMAAKALENTTAAAQAAEPKKESFDFAKGAGIFAALSVAISMLSAALAYIANSFLSLGWWWPLALIVIFLCISGPSMLLAWLKLRKRSLGPLLDASGWAVNKGAPINLAMGAALTSIGVLPPNAKRDNNDPYGLSAKILAQRKRRWFWFWFLIVVLAIAGFCAGWVYFAGWPHWAISLGDKIKSLFS